MIIYTVFSVCVSGYVCLGIHTHSTVFTRYLLSKHGAPVGYTNRTWHVIVHVIIFDSALVDNMMKGSGKVKPIYMSSISRCTGNENPRYEGSL